MANQLYLECYAGLSGDMLIAALLDLGADQEKLLKALHTLPVGGFDVRISRVKKAGLDVCDFDVILDKEHENHDHDMEYLYGDGHAHDHEHPHDHGHEHAHDHGHPHDHGHHHDHEHAHPHAHRGLADILAIIRGSAISDRAKKTAEDIFTILADAEGKAHGLPADQVHFHEVGAVDSIVDIVAAAVCLDDLDITETIVPFLAEGQGFVRCQHGVIPVPVPAVVNIAQAHGLKLHLTGEKGELVTPTGAAAAAAICTSDKLPEHFAVKKIGIGAGKRNYEKPSLVRAMLIEPDEAGDGIWKLETNIDDCTGEALGYAMEQLFAAGARDVFYTPVFMKKNRPAYQLSVICDEKDIPKLEAVIFRETTSIGIRRFRVERSILAREERTAVTDLGEVQVKRCTLSNGETRDYPEHESIAALAEKQGLSYQETLRRIWKSL